MARVDHGPIAGTFALVLGIAGLCACGGSSASAPATAPSATAAPAPAAASADPAAAPADSTSPEPAAAQTSSAQTSSAQVQRGAELYARACASCHGPDGKGHGKTPAVVGEGALPLHPPAGAKRNVDFATAGDVFRWVRKTMPGDAPGSLSDDEYAAILAFDLQANGVDMSATTLDEAKADTIRLH